MWGRLLLKVIVVTVASISLKVFAADTEAP